MPKLSLDTVIARRPGPLTAPVDGELVLLETGQSMYFGLDRIGRRIWDLLEQPQSVAALCGTLEGEFEVEPETCRADVLAFVEEMEQARLLEVR
jgi:hypothetical protein